MNTVLIIIYCCYIASTVNSAIVVLPVRGLAPEERERKKMEKKDIFAFFAPGFAPKLNVLAFRAGFGANPGAKKQKYIFFFIFFLSLSSEARPRTGRTAIYIILYYVVLQYILIYYIIYTVCAYV